MLSCKQDESEKPSAAIWMLEDKLGWQPQTNAFVCDHKIFDKAEPTHSLYKLDTVNSFYKLPTWRFPRGNE
jgi:hypothetical protein